VQHVTTGSTWVKARVLRLAISAEPCASSLTSCSAASALKARACMRRTPHAATPGSGMQVPSSCCMLRRARSAAGQLAPAYMQSLTLWDNQQPVLARVRRLHLNYDSDAPMRHRTLLGPLITRKATARVLEDRLQATPCREL
jgi:hypothetical protein